MSAIQFTHTISIQEYNALRASVDFITICPKQARTALDNSLYILVVGAELLGLAGVLLGPVGLTIFKAAEEEIE